MTAESGPVENGPVLVECADTGEELFRRFYETVLAPSFPPAELVGLDAALSYYRAPASGGLGTIALVEGEPAAGALGSHHRASGILLLDYLATRAQARGRGLGSALIAHIRRNWVPRKRPVAVLAEVEDPGLHPVTPFGDPVARLRMYERTGWSLLPLAYFQPALAPGLPRVRGMLLICLAPPGGTVPAPAVAAFLDAYMTGCEGAETVRTDPEFLALRGQATAFGADIPLWPLSRAPEVHRR
ncbi:GNAT family N-acetyltransferase [Spongiactinospora sp. 9N601]|uniref:GNAT family N-acetyltransferase n=1 Tax=Spongiactinospora sp. 9N601 TaxID=3375149 RepID=UPI0037A848A3